MKIGKWIVLTVKLPTEPSPPKLSIFYAIPWEIDVDRLKKQWRRYKGIKPDRIVTVNEMVKDLESVDAISDGIGFGCEPVEAGAMAIYYKGEKIKVWRYEYSEMKMENWPLYYPEMYDLIPDGKTAELMISLRLTKSQRPIYDAALVDGCNDYQALLVATGNNVDDAPAPIGWFKIKPEYGKYYCSEYELKG